MNSPDTPRDAFVTADAELFAAVPLMPMAVVVVAPVFVLLPLTPTPEAAETVPNTPALEPPEPVPYTPAALEPVAVVAP